MALVVLAAPPAAAGPSGSGGGDVEVVPVDAAGAPATTAGEQLDELGYLEREFLVSGVADTYTGPADGPAEVAERGVPYTTRILVRVPKDPDRFSGRVLLEPFNTSGADDRDVGWLQLAPVLAKRGDAWVGVTDRSTSVPQLQEADPARYGSLALATNGLAWDALADVGRAIKQGGRGSPLDGLDVEHLYMTGYSQSGIDVATFLSAFHDRTQLRDGSPVYDGYLPMARSGQLTPLESGTTLAPQFEQRKLRPLDVPVIELQTEGDVEGFSQGYTKYGGALVRGKNGAHYRLYELAGTSHSASDSCDGVPTEFPRAAFTRAAYANLTRWAEGDVRAPTARPLRTTSIDTVSMLARDEHGNAIGGVRSPFVDVPLATYAPTSTPGISCLLAGTQTVFTLPVAQDLYGDADAYLQRFARALDETVAKRFLLRADRGEVLAGARDLAQQVFGPS
jgi:hypothetical protein